MCFKSRGLVFRRLWRGGRWRRGRGHHLHHDRRSELHQQQDEQVTAPKSQCSNGLFFVLNIFCVKICGFQGFFIKKGDRWPPRCPPPCVRNKNITHTHRNCPRQTFHASNVPFVTSVVVIKRGPILEADKNFSSQLRVMSLSDGSPYETLHAYVSNAVAPYFKSYIKATGKVDR